MESCCIICGDKFSADDEWVAIHYRTYQENGLGNPKEEEGQIHKACQLMLDGEMPKED